jgi:tetratricopeptide (TPR) repeat protein
MKAELGVAHPQTLTLMTELAAAYEAATDAARAEALRREVAALQQAQRDAEDLQTLSARTQLGWALLRRGQFDEAERVLRECLAGWETHNADGWPKFQTESLLGGVLLGRRQYAAAEPLLLGGVRGAPAARGDHPGGRPLAPDRGSGAAGGALRGLGQAGRSRQVAGQAPKESAAR